MKNTQFVWQIPLRLKPVLVTNSNICMWKSQISIMKMAVFWDVTPYSLVEVYRRFKSSYCLIALMMEAVSTSETSVNF
jgi:hypothetical protein